jgi:hypothetical protein
MRVRQERQLAQEAPAEALPRATAPVRFTLSAALPVQRRNTTERPRTSMPCATRSSSMPHVCAREGRSAACGAAWSMHMSSSASPVAAWLARRDASFAAAGASNVGGSSMNAGSSHSSCTRGGGCSCRDTHGARLRAGFLCVHG